MNDVTLRFHYPSGRPAAHEDVTVFAPSGTRASRLRTDDEGAATMPLSNGSSVSFHVGEGNHVPLRWRQGDPTDITLENGSADRVVMYGQLNDRTGQPAVGVGVALVTPDGGVTLASTASDPNGLFVLPCPVLAKQDPRGDDKVEPYLLEVSVNEAPIEVPDLPGRRPGPWGPHFFVVDRQPPPGGRVAPPPILMDSASELLRVVNRTPQLAAQPRGAEEQNPCAPRPSLDFPARVFRLQKFAMYPAGTAADGNGATRNVPSGRKEQRPVIRFGATVEYRQEWWDLGYALGDLLYSVPLAPCEQIKIATVDWRRRDWAKARTGVDERHYQDTTIDRDEVISESVHMVSDKTVAGLTVGEGGAFSLGLLNAGSSWAFQGAKDVTDATTDGSRTINDSIEQVSTTLRNTRSYAITEVTQEEETTATTRTVRNHNHSHTLTFQYFEVLRRFKIATKPETVRPALFVRFPLIEFGEKEVLQHGYLLRRALLDPTLAGLLDRLLDTSAAGAAIPADGLDDFDDEPASDAIKSVTVRAGVDAGTASVINPKLIVNGFLVDLASQSTGDDGRTVWTADPLDMHVADVDEIAKVGIYYPTPSGIGKPSSPSALVLEDLDVSVGTDAGDRTLMRREEVEIPTGRRIVEYLGDGAPVPLAPSGATPLDTGRLLAHLNAYRAYYSAAVHGAADAGLRWLWLSETEISPGVSIADIVENNVVGSVGDYLAFPLLEASVLPEQLRITDDSWLQAGPDERLVSLPSPGIFAESQLGHCSASEKIDNTRFWQWHRAPCDDEAPDITDAMMGSRYQDPGALVQPFTPTLTPSDVKIPELPEPMIQIGDETMAQLVKGLELPDPDSVLSLVDGLSKLSSEGFGKILDILAKYGEKAALAAAGVPDVSGLADAADAVGSAAEGLSTTTTTAPAP